MQTKQGHRCASPWKLNTLGYLGNHADFGIPAPMTRHQQHLLVATRIKRKGYRHSGEYHTVIKRYEH
jgi:hypothetical protein